ncbi:MAG: LysR family transcriptional regulator [Hydrogenophaga sp.]|uniref:LysR family transcriptional regulator n=1 Tax=Hydrogenophaga crocea TaxID=2716225 RepID=A0A6G8IDH6_9BURK|nr:MULTISPECIES: LysR family transcriptional regulator [Hydrogenophaga]MBL0942955.1 LysR family transcriptional regulator [Hydrogenophaga sp.]QIM51237.1 LysR family transcriptional regulator [Hydrogenophaga crocea]
MNISLRQLRVFQAVAAHGSFTRAGAQVGLSQPAVSRCVTELEQQLGLKLLDRTTREVLLTAAGRNLATRLERVLDDLDAVLLDVRGLATQRQGRVRIASSPTLSANLLPECIARCQREHPGLALVLLDRMQHDALASVLAGEVDFGVVIDPGPNSALHAEPVLSEPFCFVAPPTHRLARKRSVRWTELAGEPLVLLDHASGSRRLIDDALREQGVAPPLAQEVGHVTTIFRMLDAGLGVSVVPTLALPPGGLPGLVVRPLLPRIDRNIVLVRRARRVLSPLAEVAWALVARVAAERA